MTYSPALLEAVAMLDADQPGWHRRVDLDKLDFRNAKCVLGQTHGLCMATIDQWASVFRPFESVGLVSVFCGSHEPQWRSLIAERQEADRIGETLSIPEPELDEVEGVPV